MGKAKWNTSSMPELAGKTFVVTGANSGLGLATTRELANKGAKVILGCRSVDKGEAAAESIRESFPDARLEVMALDLSDLASVRAFAEAFARAHARLDVLINNAGVMAVPRSTSVDGFEMQFATNHLGHFALTGLLLEMLLQTAGARVVTVSSLAHRVGRIDFDDLDREHGYNRWLAYAQSKLANLLFALELQQRFESAGADVISVGCHPGYAATDLQVRWTQLAGAPVIGRLANLTVNLVGQDADAGALPILCAATDPRVEGGDIIGPDGFMEIRGSPVKVGVAPRARDRETAARLWSVSIERTGVTYEALQRNEAART